MNSSSLSLKPSALNTPAVSVTTAVAPLPVLANDFARQWADLGGDALAAVERVGKSGWYILGNEVRQFEQALARFWELPHAVGTGNGMDAIEIGLRIQGCGPGDKVLTTPLSAFATTLAILKTGATPVYVDVDEQGMIDFARSYDLLRERRDIGFFVPVHLYGHALDHEGLQWLCEEFRLKTVEDCAQSAGARSGGHSTGTVGQVAATSFYPTKNLGGMGDGGALLTNDLELAEAARVFRSYGERGRYNHEELGSNSRLDELQAALLQDACLPRLEKWLERRRAVADAYHSGICNRSIGLPGAPQGSTSSWHLFPVHVDPERRNELIDHMRETGIATGIHYPTAIPDQPAMATVAYELGDELALARQICACEVSLPIHPYLTDEEVVRVIDAANSFGRISVSAASGLKAS